MAGLEVPLSGYDRHDNPFVRTAFEETRHEVHDGQYGLIVDFATGERKALAPKPAVRGPGSSRPPSKGVTTLQ